MPYIKQERRDVLVCTHERQAPINAGELNFIITEQLIGYWQTRGHSYKTINDISGACTEALAEFRRRVVAKYEDQKIIENEDVYP